MKMEFSKNNDFLTLLAAFSSLFRVPIRSPSAATRALQLSARLRGWQQRVRASARALTEKAFPISDKIHCKTPPAKRNQAAYDQKHCSFLIVHLTPPPPLRNNKLSLKASSTFFYKTHRNACGKNPQSAQGEGGYLGVAWGIFCLAFGMVWAIRDRRRGRQGAAVIIITANMDGISIFKLPPMGSLHFLTTTHGMYDSNSTFLQRRLYGRLHKTEGKTARRVCMKKASLIPHHALLEMVFYTAYAVIKETARRVVK
jgi:hypothetical protein